MADSDDPVRNLACLPIVPFVAEAPRAQLSAKSSAQAGEELNEIITLRDKERFPIELTPVFVSGKTAMFREFHYFCNACQSLASSSSFCNGSRCNAPRYQEIAGF